MLGLGKYFSLFIISIGGTILFVISDVHPLGFIGLVIFTLGIYCKWINEEESPKYKDVNVLKADSEEEQ